MALMRVRIRLSSRNNSAARIRCVRQRSAEALARLAATDQRKLVEGYQLQEKNKEVRLALDWALYRMGRAEALYRVVDELDSGRQEQAIGYLSELESPDLLYPFLKRTNNAPRINAGLLKALARIGDAQTLELIKPFRESHQPYVAEAAESRARRDRETSRRTARLRHARARELLRRLRTDHKLTNAPEPAHISRSTQPEKTKSSPSKPRSIHTSSWPRSIVA